MSGLSVDIEGRTGAFSLSVAFEAGRGVTGLFGHSGAGKSTLIKMIAGLARPERGTIVISGRTVFDSGAAIDLSPERRRTGVVFQEARLFPHLSVARNLTYGVWAGRRKPRVDFDFIVSLLALAPLLERRPQRLSGGEKQRVALGRALLSDPAVLLLDEPLASLDQARRQEVLPFLESLRDEAEIPIVYVSHEVEEVARLADTLVVLSRGQVAASGPAQEVFARIDLGPVLGRHEASSILSGTVAAVDEAYGLVMVDIGGGRFTVAADPMPPGTGLRLRIKARDVALALSRPDDSSFRNVLDGVVAGIVTDESPYVEVSVRIGAQALRARITRQACDGLKLAVGMPVHALVKTVAVDRRGVSGR